MAGFVNESLEEGQSWMALALQLGASCTTAVPASLWMLQDRRVGTYAGTQFLLPEYPQIFGALDGTAAKSLAAQSGKETCTFPPPC